MVREWWGAVVVGVGVVGVGVVADGVWERETDNQTDSLLFEVS
jgi:hypothetical protein